MLAKPWPSWVLISKNTWVLRKIPALAMAAWGGWLPAISTRWQLSAVRRSAMAYAMNLASSIRSSRTAGKSRSPTSGYGMEMSGKSRAHIFLRWSSWAVTPRLIPMSLGLIVSAGYRTGLLLVPPMTPRFSDTAVTRAPCCVSGVRRLRNPSILPISIVAIITVR